MEKNRCQAILCEDNPEALQNQPKHEGNCKDGEKGAENDDRCGQLGVLVLFFRQDEIDHGRWQGTVEKQHLAIDAFGELKTSEGVPR